jgi:hypothetical protein
VLRALDDKAWHALATTLPVAAGQWSASAATLMNVVNRLGSIDDPGVTDLLLAGLAEDSSWLPRGTGVDALLSVPRRLDDPRVRATLARIAATDTDPQLRRRVASYASYVKSDPASPLPTADSAGVRPRLGVMLAVQDAGPGVPDEVVGKARIMRVSPESAAEKAGLLEGDVVLEVNGTPLANWEDLPQVIQAQQAGIDVEMLVYRLGQKVKLKVRF